MNELNEKLDLGVDESDDYDSVGGFVLATLGSIPDAGARFDAGRVHWTVDAVNGNRVLEVRLQSDEPWPDDALVAAGLREPAPREAGDPALGDPGA